MTATLASPSRDTKYIFSSPRWRGTSRKLLAIVWRELLWTLLISWTGDFVPSWGTSSHSAVIQCCDIPDFGRVSCHSSYADLVSCCTAHVALQALREPPCVELSHSNTHCCWALLLGAFHQGSQGLPHSELIKPRNSPVVQLHAVALFHWDNEIRDLLRATAKFQECLGEILSQFHLYSLCQKGSSPLSIL